MPKPNFGWDAVDALIAHPAIPPDARTTAEFAACHGLGESVARRKLRALESAGQLTSALATRDGCQVRLYWVVQP